MTQQVWTIDNLMSIGGHKTEILGVPKIIKTRGGKAVEFDGMQAGLVVGTHPLVGAERFTVEAIFRPDVGGLNEQRFLHLQEEDSENRILLETRLIEDEWFLDTFIGSNGTQQALLAEGFRHPVGRWHHAALVFDGHEMRHYVNGFKELSHEIAFTPQRDGQTSIGVRLNRISWFHGAIRVVRFTFDALSPQEFLRL